MILVTAGCQKFMIPIKVLQQQAARLGCELLVFDLGNLGFGHRHETSTFFLENGHYGHIHGVWYSKAVHKPSLLLRAWSLTSEPFFYLDADTILLNKPSFDFTADIAITIRRHSEIDPITLRRTGWSNAGVIAINRTEASLEFLKKWHERTLAIRCDQFAFNGIVNPTYRMLPSDTEYVEGDLKIQTLPSLHYNFTYFPET